MSEEKVTVSVIKADVGSVVGHSRPHPDMLQAARDILKDAQKAGTIEDFYVTRVGDDINLFMSHYKGEGDKDVHGAAWECFQKAAKIAKSMKLYAAGQDILTDAFSGNVKGAGPGSAEMSFVERGSEPMLFFMADKTEPSAYTLPLSRIFLDPFTTTGLVIDARAKKGFDVEIQDVIGHKKVVMSSPEEDPQHPVPARRHLQIRHQEDLLQGRTRTRRRRLHRQAEPHRRKVHRQGRPRVRLPLPVRTPLRRRVHPALRQHHARRRLDEGIALRCLLPLLPEESDPVYFDGPPRICCLGFQLNEGKFQGLEPMGAKGGEHIPVDFFKSDTFDAARANAVKASRLMRSQGPFMPSILGPEEMEYTSRPDVLKELMPRFEDL